MLSLLLEKGYDGKLLTFGRFSTTRKIGDYNLFAIHIII